MALQIVKSDKSRCNCGNRKRKLSLLLLLVYILIVLGLYLLHLNVPLVESPDWFKETLKRTEGSNIIVVPLDSGNDVGIRKDNDGERKESNIREPKPPEKSPLHGIDNSKDDHHSPQDDKTRLIQILIDAGVPPEELTPQMMNSLPSESTIVSLYGEGPRIIGLETCTAYRSNILPVNRKVAPAGLFNTGTNILSELLLDNCDFPDAVVWPNDLPNRFRDKKWGLKAVRAQVPWGKHNPVTFRGNHVSAVGGEGIVQDTVLPVVVVKDPYSWMGSMCRHNYAAYWNQDTHCPKLVHSGDSGNGKPNNVEVRFKPGRADGIVHYDSLVSFWNEWYGDYHNALVRDRSFPGLIIRYEDLLFHLDEVLPKICDCAGGTNKNKDGKIRRKVEPPPNKKAAVGKTQKKSNNLLSSMVAYGDETKMVKGMKDEDIEYARGTLREQLMDTFGYQYHDRK